MDEPPIFAQDIEAAAGDEEIIAIAIAPIRGGYSRPDDKPDHGLGSNAIPWAEAKPILSYQYCTGYGGQECHDFWAWTATRVLFVHEYDGSTTIGSAPIAPTPFTENTVQGVF